MLRGQRPSTLVSWPIRPLCSCSERGREGYGAEHIGLGRFYMQQIRVRDAPFEREVCCEVGLLSYGEHLLIQVIF